MEVKTRLSERGTTYTAPAQNDDEFKLIIWMNSFESGVHSTS